MTPTSKAKEGFPKKLNIKSKFLKAFKFPNKVPIAINITANSCFLFYTIVNEQYPIMFNCLSVITLEGSLVYMKHKFGQMKKSSSQTNLNEVDLNSMTDPGPPAGMALDLDTELD